MSRLADPRLCPDCRGRVGPDATCAACGLALTGPLATDLWRTMLTADGLVERLRRSAADRSPVADPPAHPAPLPVAPAVPPPVATRLPGRLVPLVLLGIGGLFVLVAVSLFLAVTWTVLPLAAKALLMLTVTAAVASAAVLLSRRGLRGATETFWGLAAGMLALDLGAAWRSDLLGLGAVDGRAAVVLGGLLLAVLGLAAALWVRRTPALRCLAAETVLVLGALAATAAGCWSGPYAGGGGQLVGTLVLAGAGVALRLRLREAAYAVLSLAVSSGVLLALVGVRDGAEAVSRGAYWAALGAWQLLAAAALATVVALLPRLPALPRTLAAAGALGSLAAYVLLPGTTGTGQWLLLAAVAAVLAVVTATTTPVWARAAASLGALVVIGTVLTSLLLPVAQVADLRDRAARWTGSPALPVDTGVPTWPLPVLLVACAAVVAASLRLLGQWRAPARQVALAALPGVSGLALAAALGGTTAPLWLAVAVLALTAVASGVPALLAGGPPRAVGGLLAGEAVLLALVAASRSDEVTAVLATVLTLLAAGGLVVARHPVAGRAPGVAAVLLAAYAAYAWTLVAATGGITRAVVLAGVAGASLLAAAYVARHPATRLVVELSTVAPSVAALTAAGEDPTALAVVLTVLGSSLTLLVVLHRDRTTTSWGASTLLALATLVRVGDPAGSAPELYALPAAVLLLAVGLWRLRREAEHPTWPLLGPGLSLALGPSLLLALVDPTSTRTVLVGVGGALALGLGAERRWQAPFLVGSTVLVVLALRFLGPLAAEVLADPLGAWVLFGLAGAALLGAGVAWERSLGRLRTASRHLAAMR